MTTDAEVQLNPDLEWQLRRGAHWAVAERYPDRILIKRHVTITDYREIDGDVWITARYGRVHGGPSFFMKVDDFMGQHLYIGRDRPWLWIPPSRHLIAMYMLILAIIISAMFIGILP